MKVIVDENEIDITAEIEEGELDFDNNEYAEVNKIDLEDTIEFSTEEMEDLKND
ncbi:MAG: hypothetical protein IJI58_00710 [Bacilli bacterium]|nr:hypothetical protein [Bacilli bacterium]